MIKLESGGQWDIHFKKFNEHISITKLPLMFKNIIFGGFYVDVDGVTEAINHTTGEKV